ncbi:uncharacterized protein LOC113239841 isoform X2 [Hyposmocoma kahamanoa]|uniref:uncharacterized protein LOC113239841 isoform X2 n=1 Tax=Hyposmocoma kahamanoa TaxID=1477025 RepID=UPI000E6D7D80|nr:uncharacterized protein LOC113239841 isoform X2 [Hyposmocoma kahamanoa]
MNTNSIVGLFLSILIDITEVHNMPKQSIQTRQGNLTSKGPMIPEQNQNRRFQDQWGLLQSGGQIAPRQFQAYPSQMRDQHFMEYQKNPSQWAGQEGPVLLQHQSGTTKQDFQNQLGAVQSYGQTAPTYFQRYPLQLRDRKKIMMQNPINPSEWGRQEDSHGRQKGSQIRSQDYSEYAQMMDQVNTNQIQYTRNPSLWGRQENTQIRSQDYSEYPQMQYQMQTSQLGHKGLPQFQYQDNKDSLRSQTNMYKKFLRQNYRTTRRRRRTEWDQWIPPHLITDSSETKGTDAREKMNWTGWTGQYSGDFDIHWHPNDPKFDFTTSITPFIYKPKASSTRTQRVMLTFDDDCDQHTYYCMVGFDTGRACGTTTYYRYYTFKNICELDYVNCVQGYEVWTLNHMGACFDPGISKPYTFDTYLYNEDLWLNKFYVQPLQSDKDYMGPFINFTNRN